MNRIYKTMALITVSGLLSSTLLSGCQLQISKTTNSPSSPSATTVTTEPPTALPAVPPVYVIPDIPIPTAPGTAVEENKKALIDYSNMQDGYVMTKYLEETDKQIRILLTIPDGTEYTYRLASGGGFEVLPLSGGDGEYLIRVFEQVEGTRYALALSATISVELVDEFAPFLRPNQFVNFNKNSEVVRIAAILTVDKDGMMDKISTVYEFVITQFEYDHELAETVQSGYLPNLDLVLERSKGICFDYAAVMAAMLRSQGIPTKLVIGYTGGDYHAWISVYSVETGWIDDLIFFSGDGWSLMDPTFASSVASDELWEYIGDGTNYSAKFFH